MHDVVVTGLGLLSRFGAEADAFLRGLAEPIPDAAPVRVPFETNGADRAGALLAEAVRSALADAGVENDRPRPERAAVLSVSKLGLDGLLAGGTSAAYCDPTRAARAVAAATGPCAAPIAACATGLSVLLHGARLVGAGEVEEAVVGVGEASLHPLVICGFDRMGVVTRSRPRPFDRRRDGFVLAEGAAAFFLERAEAAKARGARCYARVAGGAAGAAAGLFRFDARGRDILAVARAALADAGVGAADLAFVHAHATGTPAGDAAEAAALGSLGCVPVASTKGATGHALGASGGFAAAATILSLARGETPPTAGLTETDLDVDAAPHVRPARAGAALALAYGFGGQIAAVVFAK